MRKKSFLILIIIMIFISSFFIIGHNSLYILTGKKNNATAIGGLGHLSCSIIENGKLVAYSKYDESSDSWKDIEEDILTEVSLNLDQAVHGKEYKEEFKIKLDQDSQDVYMRVILRKGWYDRDGKKLENLSSDFIELGLGNEDDWIIDNTQSPDTIIMYYKKIVHSNEETSNFMNSFRINPKVASTVDVKKTSDGTNETITMDYIYNGVTCKIAIECELSQPDKEAIESSWGVKAELDENGNIISINNI